MKIAFHISFYYIPERFNFMNKMIKEINNYHYETDIYIHTNVSFPVYQLSPYKNGRIHIIVHDLTNENPFFLTWKCRTEIEKQKEDYDIFIYTEDDILIPKNTIKYWEKFSPLLSKIGYNLGFIRIEVDSRDDEIATDLHVMYKLNKLLKINGSKYLLNDINTYCAMWIYNKRDMNNFINSKYWDINNIPEYGRKYAIREASAIGLHGKNNDTYKGTVIPLNTENKLLNECKIYHLPNNYVYKFPNTRKHFYKLPY